MNNVDDTDETNSKIIEYISKKRTYPFENMLNTIVYYNPHRLKHICSFGIVAYCLVTERYLVVQRRYSANYLTFLRGAYRRSNLPRLIMGMCNDELKMIRRVIFRQVNIHELLHLIMPAGDNEYSAMRFDSHENDILQLINIAQSSKDTQEEPEWLFPKGRPERTETGLETALREFSEETGVYPNQEPISTRPIVSYYKADNDFIYETRYWVIIMAEEAQLPVRFSSYEISHRSWKTRNDIVQCIKYHQLQIFNEANVQINNSKFLLPQLGMLPPQ